MTFLQLCQRAAVECGVASNTPIQTALPTTVGATGSLGRIVGWINDGWTDIQMDSDEWTWMRSSNLLGGGISFQTIAGKPSYALGLTGGSGDFTADFGPDFGATIGGTVGVDPEKFGKWDRDTFRCFPTAVGFRGEMFLDEIPYDAWRDSYMLGAMRSVQTRPVVIAVGPEETLCLGPPPNDQYTITGDYWVAPSVMVNDADIPVGLPTRFHMLIVYRTMIKYAGFESAPEVFERGSRENDGMFAQLLAARAPRMAWGGALA